MNNKGLIGTTIVGQLISKLFAAALATAACASMTAGCAFDAAIEDGSQEELAADFEAGEEDIGEAEQELGAAVVPFDTFSWSYFRSSNNQDHPRLIGNEAILVPDNRYSASAAAFYRQDLLPPYVVEFDFSTFDDDGGPSWNSADGVVLMLAKNRATYANMAPSTGDTSGFIADGTGIGVQFATYGSRQIKIKNGNNAVLASTPFSDAYTAGAWKSVKVEVELDSITVTSGATQLTWSGPVGTQYGGIGFGAATGAADSQHRIRNVKITPVVRVPVTSLYTVPITLSQVKLDGGSNSLFSLQPNQQFTATIDYTIKQRSDCPYCIDQILVGVAPNNPQACIYNGIPSMGGTSGSASVTMTAPSQPGIHDLRFRYAQDYSCNLGWWGDNGAPTAAQNFGVIYVNQDAAACSHATCATGSKLAASCDPCVAKICAADPYCCNTYWDSICVSEVAQFCGASCN
jgi:hypothetical protein